MHYFAALSLLAIWVLLIYGIAECSWGAGRFCNSLELLHPKTFIARSSLLNGHSSIFEDNENRYRFSYPSRMKISLSTTGIATMSEDGDPLLSFSLTNADNYRNALNGAVTLLDYILISPLPEKGERGSPEVCIRSLSSYSVSIGAGVDCRYSETFVALPSGKLLRIDILEGTSHKLQYKNDLIETIIKSFNTQ